MTGRRTGVRRSSSYALGTLEQDISVFASELPLSGLPSGGEFKECKHPWYVRHPFNQHLAHNRVGARLSLILECREVQWDSMRMQKWNETLSE